MWKHAVLVALADSIGSSTGAVYVESHCGAPVHQLARGGEWERGVGRLVGKKCDSMYMTVAASWLQQHLYPASWVIVVNRLAGRLGNVKAILADISEEVAAAYHSLAEVGIPPNVSVEFHQADGFEIAAGAENADLIFMDPPFYPDAEMDWRKLADTCLHLAERNVPFVAWYPFHWPTRPQWLTDTTRCEAWEVAWAACGLKPSQNLKGCGMLASAHVAPALRNAEQELKRVSSCLGWEFRVRSPAAV